MENQASTVDIATLPNNQIYLSKGIALEDLQELRRKGLTYRQIAKVVGCSHANVIMRLEGFESEQEDIETYRGAEADLLTGLRLRIIRAITNEEIQKAPLQIKMMALGISIDKELALTGKSASNQVVTILVNRLDKLQVNANSDGSESG